MSLSVWEDNVRDGHRLGLFNDEIEFVVYYVFDAVDCIGLYFAEFFLVFHGDVFDRTTKGSAKLLAKLGGYGYDLLILINSVVNFICQLMGREKMSLSKKVKNGVKKAVSWIHNFEQTAAELAIDNGYKYVICGHIHQPQHRVVTTEKGAVTYLNSGDWIENLTALEYAEKHWTLYHYDPKQFEQLDVKKRIKVVQLQEELTVLTNEVAFQVSI